MATTQKVVSLVVSKAVVHRLKNFGSDQRKSVGLKLESKVGRQPFGYCKTFGLVFGIGHVGHLQN
jgi:hypothetical protein